MCKAFFNIHLQPSFQPKRYFWLHSLSYWQMSVWLSASTQKDRTEKKQLPLKSDKNSPWGASDINSWRVCELSLIMKCQKKWWCVSGSFEERQWRLEGSLPGAPGKYYSPHRLLRDVPCTLTSHGSGTQTRSHDLEALTGDTERGGEEGEKQRLALICCWVPPCKQSK